MGCVLKTLGLWIGDLPFVADGGADGAEGYVGIVSVPVVLCQELIRGTDVERLLRIGR